MNFRSSRSEGTQVDLTAGIVRILGPNHETVGTGFLVNNEGLAVTCAHVILDARSGPGDTVLLVLHRTQEERKAIVEPAWWREPDAEDVAFLRLQGSLPTEVERLWLGSSGRTADHPFKSFGFPAAKPVDGMWGYGVLGDATTENGYRVRQLTSKEVTRGFSGAPVLDKITGRVVGMAADITLLDRYRRLVETSFFIPSETLSAICRDLELSDSVKELAGAVWRAEADSRSAKAARIAQRLEIQQPVRLFGVDDKLADLTKALATPGPPWLIAVVGIGGIGKTSLADASVRGMADTPVLVDAAWVSARQERFTSWGGLVEGSKENPALTFEGLIDAIIEQLDFQDLARLPLAPRLAGLRARLKAQSYLVVVDNLETAVDYRALVPNLDSMLGPSKFLLTSRQSLHEYSSVHNLRLNELSAQDSLALLRHEANSRGLTEVATTSDENLQMVYEVAGGNPLALKLLVGQMHTLSLPHVVDRLRKARGRTIEDLYRFIYWQSWHLLTSEDRRVLAIMPLISENSGGLEQIAALSKLEDESLTEALERLVTLCLADVQGPVEARRYSIHRLTETFLVNEVIKWQHML